MAKSLKINFIFNLINTVLGLVFPLITFPYVTRVLLPDGVGQVQFFQSIINYIALFAALGIPLYAVKEIAKVRDDVNQRNKTALEILFLYTFLSIISYIVVFGFAFFVNRVSVNAPLFLVLSLHIILVALGSEWFYQGIEDFGYITARSVIIRIISLVALFVFVKSEDDLLVYGLLLVLAEAGNNIFNFIHLRKYIDIRQLPWKNLNLKRHVKPAFRIFSLNIIISLYVYLDSVMLGFLCDNESVGYYAAATRLTRALSGFAGALGGVLLPRLSYYAGLKDYENFNLTASKSISLINMFTIPMVFGLISCAPLIIHLFCGSAFEPAAKTLQIIAPILIFLGISSITGTRVLYSLDQERIVIICTAIGAVINLSLNIVFIPKFQQNGAAFASLVAEAVVTLSMIIIGRKYIPYSLFNKQNFLYLLFSVFMILPIILINRIALSPFLLLIIDVVVAGSVYYFLLRLSHNDNLTIINNTVSSFIYKKKQ